MKGRDLTSVSHKTIRGELETSLSLPAGALDGQREEIMGIVAGLLQDGTCTVEKQRAKAPRTGPPAVHEVRLPSFQTTAEDSGIWDGGYYEVQDALG